MEELRHSESVIVARPADVVYALVSDVTRTGEWSPICRQCRWEDERRGVGAWFTGHNVTSERTWDTRSQVLVADPGREFAWRVGAEGAWGARWGYRLEPVDGGTRLTEDWEFLTTGHAVFAERFGEHAEEQIAERARAAHRGIPETLAAIRTIAESG